MGPDTPAKPQDIKAIKIPVRRGVFLKVCYLTTTRDTVLTKNSMKTLH